MLNRFSTGLLTGGIIAAVGIGWAVSDAKTRKRMAKDGKRAMHKAEDFFHNVKDKFD